jgi:hypothetical protein
MGENWSDMALNHLRIEMIDQALLHSLIDDKVSESKTVEYKSELPGRADTDKKEFLYDVSSFANASGGFLLFGIKAKDGIPTSVCGLGQINPDQEILRLEGMIQNGIEPRLPELQTQPVQTQWGVVIAMRIPRSWRTPHMVVFQGLQRFYGRNSAGKYPLDIGEIKGLARLSESITEKVRRFRLERVMAIEAEETPIPVARGAAFILHLVPLATYAGDVHLDVDVDRDDIVLLHTMAGGFKRSRINFDGHLTFGNCDDVGRTDSYVQLFRDGRIEAVDVSILDQGGAIPSVYFEQRIWETTSQLLTFLDRQAVPRPVVIMLTAIGVRGYAMSAGKFPHSIPIDRDRLLVPEVMAENSVDDAAALLRPCFDAIWNATALPGSQNYDREGRWTPH